MNNEHQEDTRSSHRYIFDTSTQSFKKWLETRLKANKRDSIDNFARRILADLRIPRQASLSRYRAHLSSKGYHEGDLEAFDDAWVEMRTEQIGE